MIHRDPYRRKQVLRQTSLEVERLESEGSLVVDQQPGVLDGHLGHAGHCSLEEGEITHAQRPQNQRGREPAGLVELSDQSLDICYGPTARHQIDGGPLCEVPIELTVDS